MYIYVIWQILEEIIFIARFYVNYVVDGLLIIFNIFVMSCTFFVAQDLDTFGTYFRMVFIDNFVDCPVYRPVDVYVCNRANFNNKVNVSIPYLKGTNCAPSTVAVLSGGSCKRFKLCQDIR